MHGKFSSPLFKVFGKLFTVHIFHFSFIKCKNSKILGTLGISSASTLGISFAHGDLAGQCIQGHNHLTVSQGKRDGTPFRGGAQRIEEDGSLDIKI